MTSSLRFLVATLATALPAVWAASGALSASTSDPYLNVDFSAPFIKAKVSLSGDEASARTTVGGAYGLYSAGFFSAAASASKSNVGADLIAASIETPGLVPLPIYAEFPSIHVATAGASADWSLTKLNGTLSGIIGAKAYASSIGQSVLKIIEFKDANSNNKVDEGETVWAYELARSFRFISCSSSADAFYCNSTSEDRHFNMITTMSKNVTGRTQYGEIITPRHVQVVYTIRDFPYIANNTKLAIRSIVASSSAAAQVNSDLTASGNQGISAHADNQTLQVFFGWGARAQVISESKEASVRVAGSAFGAASAGIDDKTVSGYIKAFGMAEASVKVVDIVIDSSFNRPEFIRLSSSVGSGPIPIEDDSLSAGAIAGIVIGTIAVVAIVAAVATITVMRKRRSRSTYQNFN